MQLLLPSMARQTPPRHRPFAEAMAIPRVEISGLEDQLEIEPPTQSFIELESLNALIDSENSIQDNSDPATCCSSNDLSQSNHEGPFSEAPSCFGRQKDSQLITFYSSSTNSTLRSFSFKEIFNSGSNLHQLLLQHSEDSVWWMDVQNPSDNTLRLLCSAFHVHPLTVEDIRMQETHEKMETFSSYYFACLRTFTVVTALSEISYEPQTIYMIVFREGTLTFSFSKNEHTTHVLDRIAVLRDYISINRNWIFYAFVSVNSSSLTLEKHF
jgi:hypothetical protein